MNNSNFLSASFASNFLDQLVSGDISAFLALFIDDDGNSSPIVDDPMQGKIVGTQALSEFGDSFYRWLQLHQARVENLPSIKQITGSGEKREVIESLLFLTQGEKIVKLPIALVAEYCGNTDKLTCVRLYYSTWPLNNCHRIRQPLLQPDANLIFPDVVAHYQEALAKGDLSAILDTFETESAYVREPSGGDYVFQGAEGLKQFYSFLFSFGGGAELEHCCLTDDGVNCAVEYNIVRLGHFIVPKQAGIAVYERGKRGHLIAARIYDDFEPPSL